MSQNLLQEHFLLCRQCGVGKKQILSLC